MIPDKHGIRTTRRDWLKATGGAVVAIGLSRFSEAKSLAATRFGPFKLGIQSYSLRNYDTAAALEWTQKLGLHHWESFTKHIPTDASQASKHIKQAAEYDVKVIGYGVMPFSKDHDANRKLFEFGKALGIQYLSADPTPDAFDSLDKLVDEYKIAIGIHNHGPGHRWAKISSISDALKHHHDLIGCCVDTGHFLRSKEDPVEAIETFDKRVYGVHLKDVKDAKTFTILGEGDLRTADLLKALAKRNYSYCLALEYEEKPEDPIADIRACLKAVDAAMPR